CSRRGTLRGCTPPWQAVALHEPGPMYLEADARCFCPAAAAGSSSAASRETVSWSQLALDGMCLCAKTFREFIRLDFQFRNGIVSPSQSRSLAHRFRPAFLRLCFPYG